MKRLYPLAILLALGLLAGCATMSKKECETADWQGLGFSDGSRGIDYSNLEKRRKSCSKYNIAPDDAAYRTGWDAGIRRYCTPDTGFQVGSAGQPYSGICPPDVAPAFLSGWQQGVRQYCVPQNALQLGLSGYPYRGVCPPDVAGPFEDFYRLGRDVRQARANHNYLEQQADRTERALAAERDPGQYRNLLGELARLRHDENRSDAQLIALEACMSDDWFDAGYRDGEAGNPQRSREIAGVCRNYGIMADRPGYLDGWLQGNGVYCTYDSGLYVGQSNEEYMGVCSGLGHMQFWRGYEQGRHMFEEGRYEAHPRPVGQRPERYRQPPVMHQPQPRQPVYRQPEPQRPAMERQPQRPVMERQPQPQRPAMERQPQPQRQMMERQPQREAGQRPQPMPERQNERQPQPQRQMERQQPPRATPAQPAQPAAHQPAQPAVPAQPSAGSPQRAKMPEQNGKAKQLQEQQRQMKQKMQEKAREMEKAGQRQAHPDNRQLNAPDARP